MPWSPTRQAERPNGMRFLTVLLAALCMESACAQVGRVFLTVDAIVAGSEAVYAGSIKSLKLVTTGPLQRSLKCRIVVNVDETLKGPAKKEFTLDLTTHLPEAFMRRLASKSTKFLWVPNGKRNDFSIGNDLLTKMGVGGGEAEPEMLWFRLYERDVERFEDFDQNLFTADLRVISTWKDLLKEARVVAKRYPKGPVELTHFDPSNTVAQMCGDPNAYAAVAVPIVPETEALARRLIEKPAKVVADAVRKSRRIEQKPTLTELDITSLRISGIGLLANFPSAQNRKLLQSMLTDEKLQKAAEEALQKMGGSYYKVFASPRPSAACRH